jgi:sugar lactone lactonase YvrE
MKRYASATELWMRFAAGIVLTVGIGWLAGCGGGSSNNPSEQTAAAATPTYSVAAGTYTSAQTVALSDATAGATIYYTTNGTAPTTSSTAYTGPITVGSSETVEAIAVAGGFSTSAVGIAAYVINLPAATPVFSVTPGTYTLTQMVTISSTTSGATIYYTTNGATPTTASTAYTGPISVASSETVEAIAVASGFSTSGVGSAAYVINALPAISGVVSSAAPISGAHVYLFAANTTGYGQASVSLLGAAQTGHSDSVGAYALSGTDGGFTLAGDYNCTAGTQLYLYALGGSAGNGANSAIGLMAAIGSCPATSSAAMTARVNEVSTIAAAYAMAGFATDATHVSSSGTALAQVGIANAFANAGNLATLSTGVALATTPAGNGTVPQSEIDTLANILASCVDTLSGCSAILSTATSDGTATGMAATDTSSVAINIAHHPTSNVAALYKLAQSSLFTPMLPAQPNDLAIALNFTGGGLSGGATNIAIDGLGNIWTANYYNNSVTKLSSQGALFSGANGFTGGGLNFPTGIAVDAVGNVWVANFQGNSITEFSNSGTILSGATGFAGGGLSHPYDVAIDGSGNTWVADEGFSRVTELSSSGTFLSGNSSYSLPGNFFVPWGIAIDASGDAWVTDNTGTNVGELSNSGSLLSGSNGYAGGGLMYPQGIAIDAVGNAWVGGGAGNAVVEISSAGVLLSGVHGYTGGGMATPDGIAIDGSGNVWVTNLEGDSITELSSSGAILSGVKGYLGGGLGGPGSISIDGSGNAWVGNLSTATGHSVTELIGVATPAVTPLAVGVTNKMLGTRP